MKRNLYALLVAIDRYPAVAGLADLNGGATNNLREVKSFMERKYDDHNFNKPKVKTLTNALATYHNIVSSFQQHFASAKKDDVCLFYFCGHGSQAAAPPGMFIQEPDGVNESIVCYDSRPDRHDLEDKELATLLWNVANEERPHFTVIMDCCHAADNTRSMDSITLGVPRNILPRVPHQYFGYRGNAPYPPQPGVPHIHLAAASSNQRAITCLIREENEYRSLFTYGLLRALQENARDSYRNLMKRTTFHLREVAHSNKVPFTSPVLSPSSEDSVFLDGALA